MREWDLLSHIQAAASGQPAQFPQVLVPPGDDCAVVRSPAGEKLLLKVDQLVEGRHFPAPHDWNAADCAGLHRAAFIDLVARKAIARAISDIAAMAGSPLCSLAAAALPPDFPHEAAKLLGDSLHRWGAHWNCPVVGGDLATFAREHAGPVTLGITVVGLTHATRGPVLRSGAQLGDLVYVTGRLGGSLTPDGLGGHLSFEPRLREAKWLADTLGHRLHAMLDLSDGLGIDAARLGRASGLTIRIEEARLPCTPGRNPAQALRDGEDYELLFSAHPAAEIPRHAPSGCEVTCIGEAAAGPGRAELLRIDGGTDDVSRAGWEHT